MSQDATLSTPSTAEASNTFLPSISAVREHRARQHADRILDQFAERFTEKDFFPEGGDGLLFAMLTRLPQWPVDTQITVLDDGGEVAGYLKDNDQSIALYAVVLVQQDDGTYSLNHNEPATGPESLFRLILGQLPASSGLGLGGNFHGSNSISGRIVTLREQLAGMARSERGLLFDALLADAQANKSESPTGLPNPFLPLWTLAEADRLPSLVKLHELNPQLPSERLGDLLQAVPMTESQEFELLLSGTIPAEHAAALTTSRAEWVRYRAIDGILNTRVYDPETDALARQFVQRLLKDTLGRELMIVESGQSSYSPTEPDDTRIVLWHDRDGIYRAENPGTGETNSFGQTTDSFYLALGSLLQPHELSLCGMQHERDVAGLRSTVGNLVVKENGGWFELDTSAQTDNALAPDWFKQASAADKLAWADAVQTYTQAMLEAQVPDSPTLAVSEVARELRQFARKKLQDHLKSGFGLELDPDLIRVHIPVIQPWGTGSSIGLPHIGGDHSASLPRTVSLTQLSLENVAFSDVLFLLRAQVRDAVGRPIDGFGALDAYRLVREVDIGETYKAFLRARLLNSPEGEWYKERFAQVMQAQMQLDALEAKLAGDYLENGTSPHGQEDRGYKWVKAVLDHPVDDGARPLVEGRRVRVGSLRIASGTKPDDRVILNDFLVFGLASPLSVPSAVLYTAGAKDGRCFVELNSLEDLRPRLGDSEFQDYLVLQAEPSQRPRIRWMLENKWQDLIIDVALHTENFLETNYKAQAERVIALVDEKTKSTWEVNWESAWSIVRSVGDFALGFTPFRVALPVAAVRSLYAMSKAIKNEDGGDHSSALYFVAAASFLTAALPTSKQTNIKSPPRKYPTVIELKGKAALAVSPDGLRLRTDGIFKEIYEQAQQGSASRFYIKQDGKTFQVRYDRDSGVWRLIDPRRPDAYYQLPIRSQGGNWVYARSGLIGGMPKGAKGANGATATVPAASEGPKRYTLDLTGFEEAKPFKKADPFIKEKLLKSAESVTEKYAQEGGGRFHGYKEKGTGRSIFTLDLTGIPGSTGRGSWRLQLVERLIVDETGSVVKQPGQPGVLVFDKVLSQH
ncbi:MAG: DUF6543 domain-containing protein [Pseudomonas caspiana]